MNYRTFKPIARVALFTVCLSIPIATATFGWAQETTVSPSPKISVAQAIEIGVERLIEIQNEDGAWPYEGVYRVNRKIPVGYRIGGTAICCEALLYCTASDHDAANDAIKRGVDLILEELEHPLMKPTTDVRYDVRVWGRIYALDLFCRLQVADRFPDLNKQLEPWIEKLVDGLLLEEIESGGWNYANRRSHAGFVTAPAVQALLWARQIGIKIPSDVFQRASDAMLRSRNTDRAFAYSGDERPNRPTKLPGSIARSPSCEMTLRLMGLPRQNAIRRSVDDFHEYWDELEKRRKKTGTHKPPFGIAPYYFYYGHRYAAQAIQGLPENEQAKEFERMTDVIFKTRDPDGTWNDRVFEKSRAYGTAMSMLALREPHVPLPARGNATSIDPETFETLYDSIFLKTEVTDPDLTIMLSADEMVELYGQTVQLDELDEWLTNNQPKSKPLSVLIKANGKAKTSHLQKLKSVLRSQLGEFSCWIGVDVDDNGDVDDD